jgi:hypothetical protein
MFEVEHVAHSGLIVHPDYRNLEFSKEKKRYLITLAKYPNAKVFGITTGLTMKIILIQDTSLFPFLN